MDNQSKKKGNKVAGFLVGGLLLVAAGATFVIVKQNQAKAELEAQTSMEKQQMHDDQLAALNTIEKNLSEITAHENVVRMNLMSDDNLGPLSPEERIDQEISIISDLIAQNNELIAELEGELAANNSELDDYANRNKRLQRKLASFTKQINELESMNALLTAQKDTLRQDNVKLTSDLALRNAENQEMNELLVTKDEVIEVQQEEIERVTDVMNESYYVVGNYKDLKALDVVEKEGGIIGLGATKELKDDFDKSQFTPIDKQTYTTIPVFSNKAELATTHPEDSYTWVESEGEVKWLEITNPSKFWQSSKYLVILTGKEYNLLKSA